MVPAGSFDRPGRGAVLRGAVRVDALVDSDARPVGALESARPVVFRRRAAADGAAGWRDRCALACLLRRRLQPGARQPCGDAPRDAEAALAHAAGGVADSVAG